MENKTHARCGCGGYPQMFKDQPYPGQYRVTCSNWDIGTLAVVGEEAAWAAWDKAMGGDKEDLKSKSVEDLTKAESAEELYRLLHLCWGQAQDRKYSKCDWVRFAMVEYQVECFLKKGDESRG